MKGTNLRRVTEGCPKLTVLKLDYWKKDTIDYSCFDSFDTNSSSKPKYFANSSPAPKSDPNNSELILEHLSLCNWDGITTEHVEILLRKFPNLTHLNLSGCFKLTNQAIINIGNILGSKLTYLQIRDCPVISLEGIQGLCKCTNLLELYIDGCTEVDGASVKILADGCRDIEKLGLSGLNKITDSSIQYLLLRCIRLKNLNLNNCMNLSNDFHGSLRHQCPNLIIEFRVTGHFNL